MPEARPLLTFDPEAILPSSYLCRDIASTSPSYLPCSGVFALVLRSDVDVKKDEGHWGSKLFDDMWKMYFV